MLENKDIKSILIIGISGGLAQLTAEQLKEKFPKAKIVGVDSRKIKKIEGITCQTIKYSRSSFEKLFRSHKFDVVYHLGRMSHASLSSYMNIAARVDFGLVGTKQIFDFSFKWGAKKIIFLSTFHVYGACADNPVFMDEESQLRASIKFADLRDVVEIDFTATNWMWKNQNEVETIVLRPCNIVGSQIKNAMARYLTYKRSPYPLDYNPAFQFIHESDIASVLVRSILEVPTGVYNVAPEETIQIREALKLCKNEGFPLPLFIAAPLTKMLKKIGSPIPDYLFEYLKYPCLIDSASLKKNLGGNFLKFNTEKTLKSLL